MARNRKAPAVVAEIVAVVRESEAAVAARAEAGEQARATNKPTGKCGCNCGTKTGSWFAIGHDAKFKGILARAHAISEKVPNPLDSFNPEEAMVIADAFDLMRGKGDYWHTAVLKQGTKVAKREGKARVQRERVEKYGEGVSLDEMRRLAAEENVTRVMAQMSQPLTGYTVEWYPKPRVSARKVAKVIKRYKDSMNDWRINIAILDDDFQRTGEEIEGLLQSAVSVIKTSA